MESVRIDKWLWAARFFKTRSLAKQALSSGKIKRSNTTLKPSALVYLEDCLVIRHFDTTSEVVILGLSDQRGPASVARGLYSETEKSLADKQRLKEAKLAEPAYEKNPDKRQRRNIRAFKSSTHQ